MLRLFAKEAFHKKTMLVSEQIRHAVGFMHSTGENGFIYSLCIELR